MGYTHLILIFQNLEIEWSKGYRVFEGLFNLGSRNIENFHINWKFFSGKVEIQFFKKRNIFEEIWKREN